MMISNDDGLKELLKLVGLADTGKKRAKHFSLGTRQRLGIAIALAGNHSEGDFQVSLAEDGTVAFTNTAKGLNAVMVGRLFDRFYTVEASRNSTGLGLSIAKHLTEAMGGKIEAHYFEEKLNITLKFPMIL